MAWIYTAALGLPGSATAMMAHPPSAGPIAADRVSDDWVVEAEDPAARVTQHRGVIDIDTPKGLTLWWRRPVAAPVVIRFQAMAVARGGANDRVSDLNAFWMARNDDGGSVLARRRSGAFADYDTLRTYYVGIGGNRNTTTRFRRYVGRTGDRPLLPGHDKSDEADMLRPNRWTTIRLIADGRTIAVERDGRRLFTLDDPAPYTAGHFGLRTTWSHLRIRRLSITPR
ncbi:Tat pathway signal sequence domain protein [Sphingomonas sp. Leaf17]|uniref:DUF6250 domain-containing protein n=1 Tax=Sphingomonas sp. Leaf17 TaxID=1735683 RepID=UPI0006FE8D8D|nr:DUF6250 domain-containing protein [Sphingomonas sp. Leaf17]KQM68148.1 Tat pathway signal sequence domain protein [Sphingomonas sp. Leaf17]